MITRHEFFVSSRIAVQMSWHNQEAGVDNTDPQQRQHRCRQQNAYNLLFVVTPKKAKRKDCLVYLEVSQDWSRVLYDADSSVLQLSVVQLV